MSNLLAKHINWRRFSELHENKEEAFEDLCRMLFRYRFFRESLDVVFHSNPNNPGIEIEPVIDPTTGKRISFQAKYFASNVNYSKIKSSMDATIKHYAGRVDCVYLYSNKDISNQSAIMEETINNLAMNNIEVVLVTNKQILDSIIVNEWFIISAVFFNNLVIKEGWFKEKLSVCLEQLGPRFTAELNVETQIEKRFGLFCQT